MLGEHLADSGLGLEEKPSGQKQPSFLLFSSFFFPAPWPFGLAYEILVPRPGTEPVPSAVEAQSRNHTREVPFLICSALSPSKPL